ncbi:MAG: hypothetical protein H7831_08290 [Magnetococcus sp. WYHC-3]
MTRDMDLGFMLQLAARRGGKSAAEVESTFKRLARELREKRAMERLAAEAAPLAANWESTCRSLARN